MLRCHLCGKEVTAKQATRCQVAIRHTECDFLASGNVVGGLAGIGGSTEYGMVDLCGRCARRHEAHAREQARNEARGYLIIGCLTVGPALVFLAFFVWLIFTSPH